MRWVFKGATVHSTKDASAGGGVSGSKYSLEPRGKVAQAAEENITGRIWPKTESWRNKEWFVVMDCRGWELKRLYLIIRGLMLGMGFGSSISSTFRVFFSALRRCYASFEFVARCPSTQADPGMLDHHFV